MKDAVCLECDCKIDVTVISCRATACNALFSVITVAVVLAFGNAYLINIAWNLNIPSCEFVRRRHMGVPHQSRLRLYRHGGSDLIIEGLAAEGAVLVHVQIVAHLHAAQLVRRSGPEGICCTEQHLFPLSLELVGQLSDGGNTLASASGEVKNGIAQLSDGASQLKDGAEKFNEEGIKKLQKTVEDALEKILDKVDALTSEDCSYDTYSGKADNMDGNVKFIIETDAIE